MPVPFGFSVGDCISVCILIKDAIHALDSTRGSSAEYQEIIRELWTLDRALLEVVNLAQSFETTAELNALRHTAKRTAEQCKICVEGFLGGLKGHERALREGGSGSKIRDIKGKLGWALCGREHLARFRAEINGHSSAINMLLITASVSLTKLNDKNLQEEMENTRRANEQSATEQSMVLGQLKDILDEHTSSLEAQGNTTARLAEGMKYFFTLGVELKAFMKGIWILSFRSYKLLLDLQARVPREFEPCWIQEPLILTDALGRVAPVHLELINTWDVLDAVLSARFRNIPGEQKISRKEYALQDHGSARDIERTALFETSFFPGRKVDMSMVFSRSNAKLTSCPGCGIDSDQDGGTASICKGCGMWFQRIEEIVEYKDSAASLRAESLQYFEKVEKHAHPEAIRTLPRQKKRKLKTSNVEEDMSFYKRVRLLHRKYVGLPTNHKNIPRNFESTTRERGLSQGCDLETNMPEPESFRTNVAGKAGSAGDINADGSNIHIEDRPSLDVKADRVPNTQSFRQRTAPEFSSQVWTVHISLLPTFTQPFPFEKDTVAYRRCLSRGLHRVIVVPSTDGYAFKNSVDQAFSNILRGRPWDPLFARILDAKHLRGIPMLRQLPEHLVGSDYNAKFLQQNCAVIDESGKILDLYIAMSEATMSWAELKEANPFQLGLEASWNHDPLLDGGLWPSTMIDSTTD